MFIFLSSYISRILKAILVPVVSGFCMTSSRTLLLRNTSFLLSADLLVFLPEFYLLDGFLELIKKFWERGLEWSADYELFSLPSWSISSSSWSSKS